MPATKKPKQSPKKAKVHKVGNRLVLAAFILFFAAIGSYFVFLSQAASPQLTWAPPTLSSPITVTLSNSNKNAKLDPTKDYIVKLSGKITGTGSVNISGGRNVVLIGGEINHTETGGPANNPGKDQLGLTLKNWTGTMHVEGLYISGTTLGEGIDVDTRSPGAILQLQNIRVDTVKGTQATNHADIVQNWGGPTVYRIDRLTGSTSYQGFMVQPIQFDSAMLTKEMDFRNINVTGANTGYKFFRASGVEKITFTNVYFQPSSPNPKVGYPESDPVFKQIKIGLAPTDFVPAGVAGAGYVSPGYGTSQTSTTTPTTPTNPTVPTTPTTPIVPLSPIVTPPNTDGTVSGTVTVQVQQTPSSTVKTEIFVDGALKQVVTNGDVTSLNTANLENGNHTVTVRSTDVNGAITESSSEIEVSNSLWRQIISQATSSTGKVIIGSLGAAMLIAALFIFNVPPVSLLKRRV